MNELRLFLQEHADKADSYEVWGGSKRPSSGAVLMMGTLRDVYRSHLHLAATEHYGTDPERSFLAEAQVHATLAVAVATDDLAASFAQHFPASS